MMATAMVMVVEVMDDGDGDDTTLAN